MNPTRAWLCVLLLAVATACLGWGDEGAYALTCESDFASAGQPPAGAPKGYGGAVVAPWVVLRGDWYLNTEGRLRTQRTWPSDSAILLDIPFRGVDVRVLMDVWVGEKDLVEPQLQSGEVVWGGGGIVNPVAARVTGKEHGAGKHTVRLDVSSGLGLAWIDGKEVFRAPMPPNPSFVNCRLAIRAMPCAEIDNLKIYTRPSLRGTPWGQPNTPEQNRAATVDAKAFLDPALPDCGFQRAIDSLPSTGGCVILPEGHFAMRRHLVVPSFTTLRGQGAGKTVLEHVPTASNAIVSAADEGEVHQVTVADASGFAVGDAVCFGSMWGHPGSVGVGTTGNRGVLVTGKDGNVLTLTEAPPPKAKRLTHVFPLIYAREAEFVEVKDLTLLGPAANDGQAGGRFMNNLVTFGVVAAGRVTRVEGRRYPADGFSFQGGADLMVTDNTIGETQQALHPGTTTRRFLCARNLAAGNRTTGLFFCWYNTDGVYLQNTLDGISGFADAGDFFNVLALNDITGERGLTITTGAASLLYGNRFGAPLRLSGLGAPPGKLRHLYEAAPRFYVIAANRGPRLVCDPPKKPDGTRPAANVFADNRWTEPPDWGQVDTRAQVIAEGRPLLPPGLKAGCGRTGPVPPPELPEPVLDGRRYYDPAAPDQGFGKALAELAENGGTLRLPAGRYLLKAPLRVPDNVTLCGQGLGTVLIDDTGNAHSAIEITDAERVEVRELVLEATSWSSADQLRQPPLLTAREVARLRLIALDLRGPYQAAGVRVEECQKVVVVDCRAFESSGFSLHLCRDVSMFTNVVSRYQRWAIELDKVEGRLLLAGNIAWSSDSGQGAVIIRGSEGGCFAANQLRLEGSGRGVVTDGCESWSFLGNVIVNPSTGIALDRATAPCEVRYNLITDTRIVPEMRSLGAGDAFHDNIITGLHGAPLATGEDPRPVGGADNIVDSPQPSGTSFQEWQDQ